jgi:hypothetical protein
MAHDVSSYYPPRAHWYSPFLNGASWVRRRLALGHIHLPSGISLGEAMAGILFPGAAFYVCGRRRWGQVAIGLSAALLFANVAWFGSQTANAAFGLLLSLHASGVAFLCDKMLPVPQFRTRLVLALAVLVLLACVVYLPARALVQERLFFPLRVNGRVVIVRREAPSIRLNRGDVIAYSFEGFQESELIVRAGFGLGPVLALPGDRVRFTKMTFEVNGKPQARLDPMPESGEFIVSERHWFVWPEFGIHGHGNVIGRVPETLLRLSNISEQQFLGQPCHWWFWRQQVRI